MFFIKFMDGTYYNDGEKSNTPELYDDTTQLPNVIWTEGYPLYLIQDHLEEDYKYVDAFDETSLIAKGIETKMGWCKDTVDNEKFLEDCPSIFKYTHVGNGLIFFKFDSTGDKGYNPHIHWNITEDLKL